MSKMACRCGHIVSDLHYPSPTEGSILRQQDVDAYYDGIEEDVAQFYAAIQNKIRTEWLHRYFSPLYPTETSDASVVISICQEHSLQKRLSICECENCGRLYVQRANDENSYLGYAPDEEGYHAVLKSR